VEIVRSCKLGSIAYIVYTNTVNPSRRDFVADRVGNDVHAPENGKGNPGLMINPHKKKWKFVLPVFFSTLVVACLKRTVYTLLAAVS
jgi:hypothetical protein